MHRCPIGRFVTFHVVLLASVFYAGAADWFVATNGSDGSPGDSWPNAFLTLSNAVAQAYDTDRILVSNGTYNIATQIVVLKGITIQGVGGAENTIVCRTSGTTRIFYLSHPAAVLDGLTITNGYVSGSHGGGVRIATNGTVINCIIAGNQVGPSTWGDCGAGAYLDQGGVISNCVFRGNWTEYGHGCGAWCNYGGLIVNCRFVGNTCVRGAGGGVYFEGGGTLRNCLLYGNNAPNNSGGAYFTHFGGLIENCTVSGNFAYTGGGSGNYGGATVRNTILYHNNVTLTDPNHTTAHDPVSFSFTCIYPAMSGTGNTSADPEFVNRAANDFHLLPASPCLNAGTNLAWMTGATDLDGNPRLGNGTNDMGAYEYNAGPLQCGFTGTPLSGMDPLAATFTAYADGTNTSGLYYLWDFNNDSTVDAQGADKRVVTNTFAAGLYSVSLTVTNDAGETASYTKSNYVQSAPAVVYVATNGASVFPYTNWAIASTSIQAAVDAGIDGTMVWVSNGLYSIGSQILIGKGIAVQSVNGARDTLVARRGPANHRVFKLTHASALLNGLTISNGYTTADFGGGVYLTAGTVTNCLIVGNTAWGAQGGGAGCNLGGTLQNCILTGNNCNGNGGAIYFESGGTMRNCLLYGNWAGGGGGLFTHFGGLIENCTVASNSATYGGGMGNYGGGTIRNTIIHHNTATMADPDITTAHNPDSFSFTCATPLQTGPGNITDDPEFANPVTNNFRLMPSSPCINTGTNLPWMATVTDLDGNPRILGGTNDMGAYEYNAGPLQCGFLGSPLSGMAPLQVTFTATAQGTNTLGLYYRWDFNNDSVADTEGGDRQVVTNVYAAGLYSVALTVTNAAGETASLTKAGYVQSAPAVAYVSGSGTHQFPFTNWAVASTTLQAAVDAGASGTLVLVAGGTYSVTSQITISKGLTLRSVSGPLATVVARAGPANHRVFSISHAGAVVDGFTITNGYTTGGTNGAGVYMTAGTVQNCIIAGNSAYGGGVLGGGVYAPIGLVQRCIIRGNYCQGAGGGADIEGSGVLRSCLIVGNTAADGGGVFYRWPGIQSCTIVSNRATSGSGGGTYSWQVWDALQNSIVYFNNPSNVVFGGGWNGTSYYCCSVPALPGIGNFTNNPVFRSASAGDYRVAWGSPCLNVGSNQTWMTDTFDLSGRRRILLKIVDIGAYESDTGMGTVFTVW